MQFPSSQSKDFTDSVDSVISEGILLWSLLGPLGAPIGAPSELVKEMPKGGAKVSKYDSVYKQKLPLFINYSLAKFKNQSQSARSDPFGVPVGFFSSRFWAGEGPERGRLKKTPMFPTKRFYSRSRLISEFCQRVKIKLTSFAYIYIYTFLALFCFLLENP